MQYADNEEEKQRKEALQLAIASGNAFSAELDRAIMPVFSLAQFVYELDIFRTLPSKIGQDGAPGALPLLPPSSADGGVPTMRNVTGVCDNQKLVAHFDGIASTIKANANMQGVLVSLQLSPFAVVCLVHPLNNTEDFPPGIFLDNKRIIGHDLLRDPKRRATAEDTLRGTRIVTAGPLQLRQCSSCNPYVEEAFIARLPIVMNDYKMNVTGELYPRWGFATALINWRILLDRSEIYEQFRARNMHFRLTRTDEIFDPVLPGTLYKITGTGETSAISQ
jgi:hypothetical protein